MKLRIEPYLVIRHYYASESRLYCISIKRWTPYQKSVD